jgi:uncharacterized protein
VKPLLCANKSSKYEKSLDRNVYLCYYPLVCEIYRPIFYKWSDTVVYDTRKIGKGHSATVKESFDIPIPSDFGVDEVAFVDFEGRLTNAIEIFMLEGECRATLSSVCSRCLKPCKTKLDFHVAENFVEKEKEDLAEYEDIIFSDYEIKIMPVVAQNLYNAVPMKFVCSENCQGLCPICGNNQNKASCQCQQEPTGPFAELFNNQ